LPLPHRWLSADQGADEVDVENRSEGTSHRLKADLM
jgi:hypothetical protein